MAAWLEERGDAVVLRIHAQPRAKKSEVAGPTAEGFLKVRLAAPPVEGKANRELLRFLADALGVSPRRLELVGGEKSTRKRVQVAGLRGRECESLLAGT